MLNADLEVSVLVKGILNLDLNLALFVNRDIFNLNILQSAPLINRGNELEAESSCNRIAIFFVLK